MPKLSPLKSQELIRKLRRLGFVGPQSGGRHPHMIHADTKKMVPIPMHKGKDVSVGLIHSIIRDLGITPEEWNKL
jgi:predicted RNA binding protein YcfA (HicA-like mRNA interferase family)